MANLVNFSEEHLVFSDSVPADVRTYMQRAIDNYEDTDLAESLLLKAHQLAPDELEIYISIYKFYFYKKHFNSSEQFAELTLQTAARLGSFAPDWEELTPETCNWSSPTEPQRVFMYTMKALGFIYLRTDRYQKSIAILTKLQELDVYDKVGGSVIMDLARRLAEDDDAIAA